MKGNDLKFIFGLMIGVFLMCVIMFFYSNSIINRECIAHSNRLWRMNAKSDTNGLSKTIADIKGENTATSERISVLNSRFNDLYILGGVIVTLLLSIVIGVYIKSEKEVEAHIKHNYDKYEDIIKGKVADAARQVQILISYNKIAEGQMKSTGFNTASIPPNAIIESTTAPNVSEPPASTSNTSAPLEALPNKSELPEPSPNKSEPPETPPNTLEPPESHN